MAVSKPISTPSSTNSASPPVASGADVSSPILVTSPACSPAVVEAYHALLTNVDLALGPRESSVVVVAAVDDTADAALVAANLALVAGQTGDSTLIVDGDTQTPRLDTLFKTEPGPGLAQLLKDESRDLRELARPTAVPALGVITAGIGGRRHNRLDRLGDIASALVRLKNVADRVIVVAPPVLAGTDVLRLGEYADGVVLVISPGGTARAKAARVRDVLEKAQTPVLGAVLTPR